MVDHDRIEHIFQFMEYDYLTDDQHSLVVDYENYYEENERLSDKQMETLESFFKQAAEKA